MCGFDGPGVLTPQDVQRRTHVRQELLIQSGIALAAMSLLSLGLGWLMAGRVLQPLEDSYQAQRQFVANASHELRAPLTRQRAMIEVALASPEADFSSLRKAHERVLASEQAPRATDRRVACPLPRPGWAGATRAARPRGAHLRGNPRPRVGAIGPRRSHDAQPSGDAWRSPTARAPDHQPDRQRDTPQHTRRARRDHDGDPRPTRLRVDRELRPRRSRPRRSSVSSNRSNDLAAHAPGITTATASDCRSFKRSPTRTAPTSTRTRDRRAGSRSRSRSRRRSVAAPA